MYWLYLMIKIELIHSYSDQNLINIQSIYFEIFVLNFICVAYDTL